MKLKNNIIFKILFGFLLFIPFEVLAQKELSRSRSIEELDSLEQQLNYYNEIQINDTAKVDLYIELAISFSRKEPSKSFNYVDKALSLSDQLNYTFGSAKAQQILGYLHILEGDSQKSIQFTRSSLSLFKNLNKPVEINNCLINLALAYLTKDEYDRAIEYYLDALPLLYAEQDTFNLSRAHFNIGKIYQDLGQDSLALKHYREVLNAIKDDRNRPVSSSLIYSRMSRLHLGNGHLEKAGEYIQKAIDLSRNFEINTGFIENQIVMGKIYLEQNKMDLAQQYLRSALKNLDETVREEIWSEAHLSLSTLYFEHGNLDSALIYGRQAYVFAKESGSAEHILNASDLLASLYSEKRNFEQASSFQQLYSRLQDSLFKRKSAQQLGVMTSRFEIEDRELKIDLLEKENMLKQAQLENEAVIRYSLLGGGILLIIIILLISYAYWIKGKMASKFEKKNEQLKKLNNDKNMFMRMAAHDLKNPLSSITGLAELIKIEDPSNRSEIMDYVNNILIVSFRMNEIIKNLLNVEAIESGQEIIRPRPVELQPCLKKVMNQYELRAREKQIQLHCEMPGEELKVMADESAIDGVLENLISNAIKYSPKNKNIWIKAYSENGTAAIEIQDEGPGLTAEDKQDLFKKFKTLSAEPTGGEHSNGLGLYIVKNMIERMDGSIECKSEYGNGATFIVNLPKVSCSE